MIASTFGLGSAGASDVTVVASVPHQLARIATRHAGNTIRLSVRSTMHADLILYSVKLKLIWLLVILALMPACTTAPNLIGIDPSTTAKPDAQEDRDIRIYVATTRAKSDEEGVFYSGQRSPRLNYATVDVAIPPSHKTGSVELPRRPPPDPERHLILHNAVRLSDEDQFSREIRKAVIARPRGNRTVLVFVHGYNTNMTEAVARFAQLVEDTGFTGVPILFSWPSTRRTIDYVADINSASISRDALVSTALLLNKIPLESVDILAHSMGNFVTMEAVRTLALTGKFNQLGRLNNFILASPDIDVQLFASQISMIPKSELAKFVVLLSRDDKALKISSRIAGSKPRVGAANPQLLDRLGIKVIDLTEIEEESSINHSKFANSPEIVRLLGNQLAESDTLSTDTSVTGLLIQKAGDVVSIVQLP